jgi:hypothetical protein
MLALSDTVSDSAKKGRVVQYAIESVFAPGEVTNRAGCDAEGTPRQLAHLTLEAG